MVIDKTDSFKGGNYKPTQDEIDKGYDIIFKDYLDINKDDKKIITP